MSRAQGDNPYSVNIGMQNNPKCLMARGSKHNGTCKYVNLNLLSLLLTFHATQLVKYNKQSIL